MARVNLSNANGPIAFLDVGSSKVYCAIVQKQGQGNAKGSKGRVSKGLGLQVLGSGHQRSIGVNQGHLADVQSAKKAILDTVAQAEAMAGVTVDTAVANISGGQLASQVLKAELNIGGQEVTQSHVNRLLEQANGNIALNVTAPLKQEILHSYPFEYRVDNTRGIQDPRGFFAENLSAFVHHVTASQPAVRTLTQCLQQCLFKRVTLVASPIAAGLAVLEGEEMDQGVVCIDLGAGATTISVFHAGRPVFLGVVPIGGNHITADLAAALAISRDEAERIKSLYGSTIAFAHDDQEEILLQPQSGSNQARPISKAVLVGIIQPRVEELFEQVRDRLNVAWVQRYLGQQVVLTGGGARLSGIAELAKILLEKQVRLGGVANPPNIGEMQSAPEFAVNAGMQCYIYGIKPRSFRNEPASAHSDLVQFQPQARSGFAKLGVWLRRYF